MPTFIATAGRFLNREEEADMVEYGLVCVPISVVAVASVGPLGNSVVGTFEIGRAHV